jgi:hypothetical protein
MKTISYLATRPQAAAAPILLAKTTPQTGVHAVRVPPPHLSDALSTILPADRFTIAQVKGSEFVHEQPASTAAQPRTEKSNARSGITLSSPDVGPNIKAQPTLVASANAGEILGQSAQATVRGAPREATDPSVFAKNETRLIRTDVGARTTDDTGDLQTRQQIVDSMRVKSSVVFLFLSLGFSGVSILAWLIVKTDTAHGKRPACRLDEQSRADWIDHFLTNWRQSVTRPNSMFAPEAKSGTAA